MCWIQWTYHDMWMQIKVYIKLLSTKNAKLMWISLSDNHISILYDMRITLWCSDHKIKSCSADRQSHAYNKKHKNSYIFSIPDFVPMANKLSFES